MGNSLACRFSVPIYPDPTQFTILFFFCWGLCNRRCQRTCSSFSRTYVRYVSLPICQGMRWLIIVNYEVAMS